MLGLTGELVGREKGIHIRKAGNSCNDCPEKVISSNFDLRSMSPTPGTNSATPIPSPLTSTAVSLPWKRDFIQLWRRRELLDLTPRPTTSRKWSTFTDPTTLLSLVWGQGGRGQVRR